MVYTLTLNPALDYVITCKEKLGTTQKAETYSYATGGRGMNAAKMLKGLGVPVVPVVLLGGHTGKIYSNQLAKDFPEAVAIDTGVETRVNVRLSCADDKHDFNVTGKPVDPHTVNTLLAKYFKKVLRANDLVLLMGTRPPQYEVVHLTELLNVIKEAGAKFVFDVAVEVLMQLPQYDPEIVKLRQRELAGLLKTEITTKPQLKTAVAKLLDAGFRAVVVTNGEKGMTYFDTNGAQTVTGPKVKVANKAGASDAALAGYVAGIVKGLGVPERLKWAMAAGVATATVPGVANAEQVNQYFLKTIVKNG